MSTEGSDFRAEHLRHADFLGVFAVIERDGRFLMVGNERRIGGQRVQTWDLPGGQVEPGELLLEALDRELREEIGVGAPAPRFLFVQEGEKTVGGRRHHAWRSFFFAVELGGAEPRASGEVLAVRWMDVAQLRAELWAPYHDSFRQWLDSRAAWFTSGWHE